MTSPHLAPGTVLADRYRLDERVGRGGMADVFRGRDQLLDRDIAVKAFRFDAVDGTEQARIQAEMRTLAAVRHPGLVTLYDASAGDASGVPPFLVMEYIGGPTLAQRLALGPLPPGEAAALGADLAAALHHVHANGIVHRDVKPANILLDEHGGNVTPKLTDFGIARLTDSARLTATGSTIGTANYLSPEQARGDVVGPASDVYSLGLVMIECLTGAVAFAGTGVEAAAARLARGPQLPEQFGSAWVGLLGAMTAMDPSQRPDAATVAATLGGLRADAATAPLVAGAAGTDPTVAMGAIGAASAAGGLAGTALLPSPPARSRLPWILAAAAVIAVLAAVLALALGSNSSGPATPGVGSGHSSHPSTSPVAHHSARVTSPPSNAKPPKPKPPHPKPEPNPKPKPPKPPKPQPHHGPPGHGPGHGPGGGNGDGGD